MLLATSVAHAEPTTLVANPADPGEAYVARYSTSLVVQAKLEEAGAPLSGALVGFYARRVGDSDGGSTALTDEFLFADGFTAADGVVTARLRLIEGAHGQDDFIAAPPSPASPGEPYRLRMVYVGDLPEGDPGCLPPAPTDGGVDIGDGGPADAGPPPEVPTCSSEVEVDLFVSSETSTLVLAPGNEVALGESIPLIATLTDEDGDEPAEGEVEVEKPIGGRTITFFYDLDGNGSPASNERLGTAQTNNNGQAVFDFVADPTYVVAGVQPEGIHAQFGGDNQYGLSGASGALTVFAGGPDPDNTLLSAEPQELPSNGFATSTITAILVDAFNNPLDLDSPDQDVNFTTTLGEISDIERDIVTGDYVATLTASREAGDAVVTVEVNGVPGSSITVRMLAAGCDCDQATGEGWSTLWAAFVLGALLLRRRRIVARAKGHH